MSVAALAPERLVGKQFGDGWTITEPAKPGETGGTFSVGYIVSNSDGRQGFLKLVNLEEALLQPDPTPMLFTLTRAHLFERELVEACTLRGLSRVVRTFEGGNLQVEGSPIAVPYIIFELAEGDVRRALDRFEQASLAARLRLCHEATVAVRQLHGAGIAHQDVKPSNVMVFDAVGASIGSSKLGDLGRASERGREAEHDRFVIAGDPGYAPPEQLYGVTLETFEERRLACDVYQLGSLCAFILGQAPLNIRMFRHLHPAHQPGNWGDGYSAALPYVRVAHRSAIEELENDLGAGPGSKAAALIASLTDPDPLLRGHPKERGTARPYGLQRVVSEWNQLAAVAELSFVRASK